MPNPIGMTAIIISADDHGLGAILSHLGIRVLTAKDAAEALPLAQRNQPDFAFADVLQPGMDGIALLDALSRASAAVRPGCALTCVCGFPVPETDYPILSRPHSTAQVALLLERLLPEARAENPTLLRRAEELLISLGVPAHPGRSYLKSAIAMTTCDARLSGQLSRRIYPALSSRSDVPPAHVERAIRHCIDTAWRHGSPEAQYRLFGNTIDAQRGKPTIAQMIARCADILRLEESL